MIQLTEVDFIAYLVWTGIAGAGIAFVFFREWWTRHIDLMVWRAITRMDEQDAAFFNLKDMIAHKKETIISGEKSE